MNRFSTARRALGLAVAVLAAAAALSGCAKKMTSVDASYTQVEGVPDRNARLVTWANQSIDTLMFETVTDPNSGLVSTLFRGHTTGVTGPPGIEAEIFDSTSASRYQVFRRTPNGGYAQLFDFPLAPSLRWPDTEWEVYAFDDQPVGNDPLLAYVGRGMVGGVAGASSPLTNAGLAPDAVIAQTLKWAGPRLQADSNLTVAWTTDANAIGYWLEILPESQPAARGVTTEAANAGLPVLTAAGGFANLRAFAYAGNSQMTVMTRTPLRRNQLYLVRIDAVDANGRVINRLQGDYQVKKINTGGPFAVVPLGGVVVEASTPVPGIPYGFDNDDFQTWAAMPHFSAAERAAGPAAITLSPAAAVGIGGNFMMVRLAVH